MRFLLTILVTLIALPAMAETLVAARTIRSQAILTAADLGVIVQQSFIDGAGVVIQAPRNRQIDGAIVLGHTGVADALDDGA